MKQFIKEGKIYNSPITITIDGKNITSNSENYLAEFGFLPYIVQPKQLTIEELIKESDDRINKETDDKILNDFSYNGEDFYLSIENQINFANMFTVKDYLTYPQTIKTKTGYTQLSSSEDVTNFYLSGIQFVKKCLEECWSEKQQAASQISAEFNSELSGLTSGQIE